MFRNVGANWIRLGVALVVTLFLLRFNLARLGEGTYGAWLLVMSVTGYLSLMVLGVPMASVRYFAESVAKNDREGLNRAIGSCAALYAALGLLALVATLGLYGYFEVSFVPRIPSDLLTEARAAFWLVALFIATGFLTQLPYGVMVAHHDFVGRNAIQIGGIFLKAALTVLCISVRPSIVSLAVVMNLCQFAEFGAGLLYMRRRFPEARLRFRDADRRMVRSIFSFSVYVLVLNLGTKLAYLTDAQVIHRFLPDAALPLPSREGEDLRLTAVTIYEAPNGILVHLVDLLIGIGAVVMPLATRAKTLGETTRLEDVFLQWSKVAVSITLVVSLFLYFLGPEFLVFWLGKPSFKGPSGDVLRILVLGGLAFLPMRGVALPILMGLGRTGAATIGFLVTGLINVGLSIHWAGDHGLAGIALGTAIPNVAFGAFLAVFTCRELNLSVGRFVRHVVPRPLIGVIPLALLLHFLEPWALGFWRLFASGLALAIGFAIVWIGFVYRGDPHLDPGRRLAAIARRVFHRGSA